MTRMGASILDHPVSCTGHLFSYTQLSPRTLKATGLISMYRISIWWPPYNPGFTCTWHAANSHPHSPQFWHAKTSRGSRRSSTLYHTTQFSQAKLQGCLLIVQDIQFYNKVSQNERACFARQIISMPSLAFLQLRPYIFNLITQKLHLFINKGHHKGCQNYWTSYLAPILIKDTTFLCSMNSASLQWSLST